MNETEKTTAELWGEAGRLEVSPPELSKVGKTVFVKRLSVEALLISPRLPGPLLTKVLEHFKSLDGLGDGSAMLRLADLPVRQAAQMPDVVNAVLIHTLDGPFAVLEGADPSKNQINVARIPDADRQFLFTGAMSDWPEMAVRTEGGAVSIEDLASFPAGGAGNPDAAGGEGVQAPTQ
jgi:hypothetical protein